MPSMDALKRSFESKYKALQQEYERCQQKCNQTQTQQSVSNSKLSSLEREKQKIQQTLSNGVIRLSSQKLSLDDDIDAKIQAAKQAAEHKQGEYSLAKCGRTLYSKFNKLAQKKHQCPVCRRAFESDEQERAFIKTQDERIRSVEASGAIEKHEAEFKNAQKKWESLQSLLPIYQNAKKQQQELQDLETEFKRLRVENSKYEEELEVLLTQQIECKSLFDKACSLRSPVNELCNQYETLQTQQREFEREKQKLQQISANKRNLKDVEEEYQKLSDENHANNQQQNKLRRQINEFDRKRRAVQQQLLDLQTTASKFEKLNTEQQRIKDELRTLTEKQENVQIEMAKLQSQIQPMQQSIRQKEQQRRQHRNDSKQQENRLHAYLKQFSNDIADLRSKITEIKRAEQKANECRHAVQDIKKEEEEFEQIEKRLQDRRAQKENLQKWIDNVVLDKQDLESNIAFRQHRRSYEGKKQELQQLREKMKEIAPNAENITEEIEGVQQEIAKTRSTLDMNKGIAQSEKLKAIDIMKELRGDKYREIDERYRQQLIKHESTLVARSDLEKFEKALDRSLIEFHSMKMKEINLVLKELWQQTYRGKDIDFIEIVSEIGDSNKTSSKRKNYNYNVVMRQGDATIPMRGRCSAGQRVLASLLIRLALAETFCVNCGVLALDEPTTNLDSKNIEALAYALNQIIARRKRQENFQLILITHDEEFVEKLGQREHTDGFYRVFKNDFQHSKAKLYRFHQIHQNPQPETQQPDRNNRNRSNHNKRARANTRNKNRK